MFRFAKRALISALIVAAVAAPLNGMAAPVVRDARQSPCKLVSAPFAAYKTPYRTSRYVCDGVVYSIYDPRLTRANSGSIVQADGGRSDTSVR